jgi:hypothetical protein
MGGHDKVLEALEFAFIHSTCDVMINRDLILGLGDSSWPL